MSTEFLNHRSKIERMTRRPNKLWLKTRHTRITASIADKVVRTCRTGNYATGFLRQHILCSRIRSAAIEWGIKNEDVALRQYNKIMGETFSKCGIFIDSKLNLLSATPDGVNDSESNKVSIFAFKHLKRRPICRTVS